MIIGLWEIVLLMKQYRLNILLYTVDIKVKVKDTNIHFNYMNTWWMNDDIASNNSIVMKIYLLQEISPPGEWNFKEKKGSSPKTGLTLLQE